ncbi:MAG: helix-turn-helix domain-containing protein [Defluviitaleaceae bacterium]|nr:helix-turn-helix domain-containing protein [Defluviitaleaceae bacterium]
MIYYKTLANLRKSFGLSHAELANALGCTEEHIHKLETNRETASFALVSKIKEIYNLQDAPIFESEREAHMEQLYNWKVVINYGDIDKAHELKPVLEKATMSSFSPSTINM